MASEASLKEKAEKKRRFKEGLLPFLSWLPIWSFEGGSKDSKIKGLTLFQALSIAESECSKNRPAKVKGLLEFDFPL